MNIEQIVTSLELSEILKELGVKQQSLFYWGQTLTGHNAETEFNLYFNLNPSCNILREYCAYTASELLELLTPKIYLPEKYAPFDFFRFVLERSCVVNEEEKIVEVFIINYVCDAYETSTQFMGKPLFKNVWDENLCNALAKMVIHLHETKLSEVLPKT